MNSTRLLHSRFRWAKVCLVLLLAIGSLSITSAFFASVARFSGAKNSVVLSAQAEDKVGETLSLDAYGKRLGEGIELLEDARASGDQDAALLALEEVFATLASIDAVALESGRLVQLTPPVDGSGEANAPDTLARLDVVLARLQLIRNQIEAASLDDAKTRLAALDDVFARPEFNVQESLRQRFLNWVEGILNWFFPNRNSAAATGATFWGFYALLTWTIGIVGALALALLFAYWLRNLLGGFISGPEYQAQASRGDNIPLTALGARAQATEYAQAGNYRDAVRQLYLSALLSMEESGVIRYDRSLTNREVLARVASQAKVLDATTGDGHADRNSVGENSIGEHLKPVVETFDSVWYGVREPDAETFSSYEEEIDELNQAMNRRQK